MPVERVDTVVVGAGQAGLAMSEHLRASTTPHLVLERSRIAERWRSERWDSLVTNGPAWHDRFPGMEFTGVGPDDFPGKEQVADYFEAYAKMIGSPVRCGVTVTCARRNAGRPGFTVETSNGTIEANNVVAATGAFQKPVIPAIVADDTGLLQIHSTGYKNPGALPPGGVLVVGAGSSGAQIAEELLLSGRDVYLSVGAHDRPPRTYRGRDFCWWLGVLGKWDSQTPAAGAEHVTIAVSGARGGQTVDFRRFAAKGMKLVGVTQAFRDGVVTFAPDLAGNIARGDANYLSLLQEADDYIARNGLDLPQERDAWTMLDDPECLTNPILELDLAGADIRTIIWATGFTVDYGWLEADVFDAKGRPVHQRGVTSEPGVYFLGLPWQSRRGSTFIWGVWHDAKFLADHIATQRRYRSYRPPSGRDTAVA